MDNVAFGIMMNGVLIKQTLNPRVYFTSGSDGDISARQSGEANQ
jgi:hypothetical protein